MKVFILEDEPLIAQTLKIILNDLGVSSSKIFSDYESASSAIVFTQPELAFIDIQIKGKQSGIDFAKECKRLGIPFIFITSFNDQATINSALNTSPINYITKPFRDEDIRVALSQVSYLKKNSEYILIEDGHKSYSVKFDDLLFIMADTPYVKIYTETRIISVRNSLSNVIELFQKSCVVRVHKSYAISTTKIQFKDSNHCMINEYKIPISKNYF